MAKKSAFGRFIRFVRHTWFCTQVEREIFNRIFPHLERERKFDYPFHSDETLKQLLAHANRDLLRYIDTIEIQARHMGKAHGDAFRFIMYRDLNERMLQYLNLAQWRVPTAQRIPEFA